MDELDRGLLADIRSLSDQGRADLSSHYAPLTLSRCLVVTDRTCLAHATPKYHPERPERLLACAYPSSEPPT